MNSVNWQAISPFFTVALPMIITFIVATWTSAHSQNRRVDDLRADLHDLRAGMNRQFERVDKRFEQIERRLERIEAKSEDHTERIARLEGPSLVRTS